jgi:hypothetical protein
VRALTQRAFLHALNQDTLALVKQTAGGSYAHGEPHPLASDFQHRLEDFKINRRRFPYRSSLGVIHFHLGNAYGRRTRRNIAAQ